MKTAQLPIAADCRRELTPEQKQLHADLIILGDEGFYNRVVAFEDIRPRDIPAAVVRRLDLGVDRVACLPCE